MADILEFNSEPFFFFFLVVVRVSGIFVTAPILSSENVPRVIRLYMVIICSMILFSILPPLTFPLDQLNPSDFLLLGVKEVMIGLLLGIIPRVMFAAVNFAGTIIGFQMGLSLANVVDPQTDAQVSIVASLETIMITLLFIVLDGHHVFFEALTVSYEHIPIAGFQFSAGTMDMLTRIMGDLVIVGLKLGAPIIVSMLLANVIMGFMARSIPQMNVFIVGFPFTIGLGFIMLLIGVPHLMEAMTGMIDTFARQVLELLQIMGK